MANALHRGNFFASEGPLAHAEIVSHRAIFRNLSFPSCSVFQKNGRCETTNANGRCLALCAMEQKKQVVSNKNNANKTLFLPTRI